MVSPLQSFLGAQERNLGIQQKQMDLQGQEMQAALGKAKLLSNTIDAIGRVPAAQRLQVAQQAASELERFGVQFPGAITEQDVTDEGLARHKAALTGFIQDPQAALSQLTAGQRDRQQRLEDVRRITDPNTGQLKENLTPEERAIAIRERLLPGAQGSASITTATTPGLSEQVGESQRKVKLGETRGKEQAGIEAVSIQEGRDAAKGIPVLKRSIALLDEIKTGGFNSAAIKAKQFFGFESADEGELSANLGQAVLGDLRATFGAAFTEKEGARLESIRANLGRSPAANRRLINQALQIAENAAERAADDALAAGDTRTFEEIQGLLDFRIQDEAPTQGRRQGGQLMIDANGNRAMVYPDGTFEEL